MKKRYLPAQLLLAAVIFSACRKDASPEPGPAPADGTSEQLVLDSIFLYAKETYLWYDALPSYADFNPRRYAAGGDELSNFRAELFDITQYKINPATSRPYEAGATDGTPKYSFIEKGTPWGGDEGTVSLADKGDDFGLGLATTSTAAYIRYVNPSSPADAAGLSRGDRITAINGIPATTANFSQVSAALDQSSITMTVQKKSGGNADITLAKASYTTRPVLKRTVLNAGTRKVGYLALSRFSVPGSANSVLEEAFRTFAAAGVTSLVIDLRYNGGGYTETAEKLVNLIAPSSLNNKVMYTEYFNDLMRNGKAPILKHQIFRDADGNTRIFQGRLATYADVDFSVAGNTNKFSKEGSLENIRQVVFIVTGNTASASELVINSLKPYLTVKLVGTKTYGKPVGFFGLKIGNYTVYLSNFQIRNSNDEGSYFDGMSPDIMAADDITHDFGDPAEVSLAAALSYLSGAPGARAGSVVPDRVTYLGEAPFNGMIENRVRLR